jgi:hypothetical protein
MNRIGPKHGSSGRALLGSHSDFMQQGFCRKGTWEKAAIARNVGGAQMSNATRGDDQTHRRPPEMDTASKLQAVQSRGGIEISQQDPYIGSGLKNAPRRIRTLRLDDVEACLA